MLEGAPDDEARFEQRDKRVCPLEIARHVSSRRSPTPSAGSMICHVSPTHRP